MWATSYFSQRTAWGFKWSNPVDKIHNEKFISKGVQDWLSYISLHFPHRMNRLCCPAGFLRDRPGQPAVTERIRPTADGFIWLALSVQRPVYHRKSQTTNPFKKNSINISQRFYHSQQLKTDWRQWRPRCQNDVHVCGFLEARHVTGGVSLSRKAHFTVHWGDYRVASFIILTGFLQIQGFATFDTKCWQPAL